MRAAAASAAQFNGHHPLRRAALCRAQDNTAGRMSSLAQPLLLVSDLDDTMTAHSALDALTEEFKQFWSRSKVKTDCKLVYNTGRTLPLCEELWRLKAHCLAEPDVLVCGVGTRIYHRTRAGWQEDAQWTSLMGQAWEPARVRAILDGLVAAAGPGRARYKADPREMHHHKLTVLFSAEVREHLLAALKQQLAAAGMKATLITGPDASVANGYFLDLVPAAAGKGAALEYVRQGLGWQHDHIVACGDSANDLLMFDAASNVIVVGNRTADAQQWVAQHGVLAAQGQLHARARRVFAAKQPAAGGILEGLHGLGFAS